MVRARPARGPHRPLALVTDPEIVHGVLSDAAHFPGGHTPGLLWVESEADVATALTGHFPVLAIGAQSSLTGGATPRGELVLSMARVSSVRVDNDAVTAGAGATLDSLAAALAARGCLYPPVPTFTGASVGGVIATNAAGPSTFKYGATRHWVLAMTVVLPCGEVIDIDRGQHRAHPDGYFDIETRLGARRVPISPVRRPDVPKCSAGYALEAGMDLVDLFVGAEGTLGVVMSARLRVLRAPPVQSLALVCLDSEGDAQELAAALRAAAQRTWRDGDVRGIDLAAIEHADARAIDLLREDGVDRQLGIEIPAGTAAILLVALDSPADATHDVLWRMVEDALDDSASDTPLGRFCRLLHTRQLLDRTQLALPGDAARRSTFLALREAIPHAVNRRVALAKQTISSDISKLAGDFVVPFDAFPSMVQACHDACDRRQLDLAVWGHISDGNIHPNVIPRRAADMASARDALLEAGRAVIALGGSPLAEHGVGRHPLKQQLLELLHGPGGIAAMRAVKQALDPAGVLAPGVLLPQIRSA